MIGKRVTFVIAPENFLGNQIPNAAACQKLRQNRGVAERVRQPQDLAVNTQLIAVEALAKHQLPHQRLAGRDVCIRFHIHGALRDPAAGPDGAADAFIQLGVMLPAHLVGGRLALDIAVFRILFQKTQLGGKCTRRLSVSLLHRPQPGQIQMRIAHCRHQWCRGTIVAFQQRPQRGTGLAVTLVPRFSRLFKIDDARIPLQAVGDL